VAPTIAFPAVRRSSETLGYKAPGLFFQLLEKMVEAQPAVLPSPQPDPVLLAAHAQIEIQREAAHADIDIKREKAQADIAIAQYKARQWAEIERFKVGLKVSLQADRGRPEQDAGEQGRTTRS
jgi:hypothetical protein